MSQLPPQERQKEPHEARPGARAVPPTPSWPSFRTVRWTPGFWRGPPQPFSSFQAPTLAPLPPQFQNLILGGSERVSQKEGSRGLSRCCVHTASALLLCQMHVYLGWLMRMRGSYNCSKQPSVGEGRGSRNQRQDTPHWGPTAGGVRASLSPNLNLGKASESRSRLTLATGDILTGPPPPRLHGAGRLLARAPMPWWEMETQQEQGSRSHS